MSLGRRGVAAQPKPLAAVAAAPPSAWTRSCLQPPDQILVPDQAGVRQAEDALRADQERLQHKYRFMEPNACSARYQANARLPDAPNHERYSRWEVTVPQSWEVPLKYEIRTLERWFKLIDTDRSGTISRKEMVMGLRRSKELRHVMRQMQGMTKVYTSVARPTVACIDAPRSPLQRRADRIFGEGAAERPGREASEAHGLKETRRREVKKFQSMPEGVDRASKGMDFDAFVDFFREAGLLLEHGTGRTVKRAAEGDLLRDVVLGCFRGAEAPSGYGLQRPPSADSEVAAGLGGQKDGRVSALETAPPLSRLGLREDTPSELSDWSSRGDCTSRGPSRIGAIARAGALQERRHSVAEAPGGVAARNARAPERPRSAAVERLGGFPKRPCDVLKRPESARMGSQTSPDVFLERPESARAGSQASHRDADRRSIDGAVIMAQAALALGRMDVKRGPPAPSLAPS